MSKHNRNQPVRFSSDTAIDAEPVMHPGVEVLAAEHLSESPVEAPEALETSESASEPLSQASEAGSEASVAAPFIPTRTEPISSQHEVAQHIAAMLAEEGAEMESERPDAPSDEMDAELEAALDAALGSGIVPLPDGSLRVSIVVPAEMVPVIKEWASGADEDFEGYLQRMIEMSLNAVVLGGAVAG